MQAIPFTVYDFFAYLSAGGILVATFDTLDGRGWLLSDDLTAGRAGLLILSAYVIGHAVAHLSSLVYESLIVQRVLGGPTKTLMAEKRTGIARYVLPRYYRPLPAGTRSRIQALARAKGTDLSPDALFLHVYAVVARSAEAQARLDQFRNLYGFARNVSLALAIAAAWFALDAAADEHVDRIPWAIGLAALAVVMFLRFLKFYRQYAYQALLTYAELP